MDSLTILIPAFNDWEALSLLLPQIDRSLAGADRRASILIVDDAATDPMPRNFPGCDLTSLDSIDILHLRCNVGHQRAIASAYITSTNSRLPTWCWSWMETERIARRIFPPFSTSTNVRAAAR